MALRDDGFLDSYDAWKTRSPEQTHQITNKYRCLDCRWRGTDAYSHHRDAHHRIVLRDAPHWGVLKFTCCPEVKP